MTTTLGGKAGLEALANKGDPAALGQALQPVWKNFFKGAVNDTLQQVPTQLVTQISAAIAANPNGDPAAIAADTTPSPNGATAWSKWPQVCANHYPELVAIILPLMILPK